MKSRKEFLKQISLLSLGGHTLLFSKLAESSILRFSNNLSVLVDYTIHLDSATSLPRPDFTILYTNDTHARHEPFPNTAFRNPGMGGAIRRAQVIDQIRQEGQPVLLFDAGDQFQGSPWFHAFEGRLELEMMAAMGYDALTIGNHEFDFGVEGFVKAAEGLGLPFVCSNYNLNGTLMDPIISRYKILTLPGRVRVGVFGLGIDLAPYLSKDKYEGVRVMNPVMWARSMARVLRDSRGCDLVVCLSHLGHQYVDSRIDDLKLIEQTSGVDLVIGGHTHTFLDAPVFQIDQADVLVPITQAGYGGIRLGRMDLFRDVSSGAAKKGNGIFSNQRRDEDQEVIHDLPKMGHSEYRFVASQYEIGPEIRKIEAIKV